jgi:hypothetical protein
MNRNWNLVAAARTADAASAQAAAAWEVAAAAGAAARAAWDEYDRLAARSANEASATAAVTRLRRDVTSRPVETPSRRPAAETAAFLVNAHDDGVKDADRAARRWDGAGGVPRADRVDNRVWILTLLPSGEERWQTHPDPVEF